MKKRHDSEPLYLVAAVMSIVVLLAVQETFSASAGT